MEGQLYLAIVAMLESLNKRRKRPAETFGDEAIVKVFYWGVIHDRPVSWAVDRRNWPLHLRRQPLPSDATMSRRLRTTSVRQLLTELERRVTKPAQAGLYWMIDGKPLTIGGCSKDRQAGYGRAAACKAKGYKLHAIANPRQELAAWRLAPMNKDERVMAERMLKQADIQGYVAADGNYDSNPLHRACTTRGNLQLVTPRRYGPGRGTGHRKQDVGRVRSIALLENPQPLFGRQLLQDRAAVERTFGNATNWGGSLTHLPPWVRTYRRVHRWVQAKLALTAIRRRLKS